MLTDIQIAQAASPKPIREIAAAAGIREEQYYTCGPSVGKVDAQSILKDGGRNGKLILVTAITPTPAGEGKTTVSIGLTDALNRIGKKAMATLREPSMGPVFGLKGGATGGGYAQVLPMEDINLHLTGDIHAVGAANNLLAAMLDNHIQQGNALNIDPRRIVWRRCMDINDRQLRNIVSGLGGPASGVPREDGFDITVASEVMAVLCLSDDLADLKKRLERIICAYTYDGEPVTAGQLHAAGAMAVILKNAIRPNLVQTLEGSPVLVHGGPFANIAHGCCSMIATRTALRLADYTVTEAGFGADLGAEKFLDIKCRFGGLRPDAAVLVCTVRALKMHGGQKKEDLAVPNLDALKAGLANVLRHADNLQSVFRLPCVAAINLFPTDTEEELRFLEDSLKARGVDSARCRVWAEGGKGGTALAEKVAALCEKQNAFTFSYELSQSPEEKIRTIVRRIYRGKDVVFADKAVKQLRDIRRLGLDGMPVCISKTPYSFSDDPARGGTPEDFTVTVREVLVRSGAGFLVALTGTVLTMPGLPRHPAAEQIDISDDGVVSGLF